MKSKNWGKFIWSLRWFYSLGKWVRVSFSGWGNYQRKLFHAWILFSISFSPPLHTLTRNLIQCFNLLLMPVLNLNSIPRDRGRRLRRRKSPTLIIFPCEKWQQNKLTSAFDRISTFLNSRCCIRVGKPIYSWSLDIDGEGGAGCSQYVSFCFAF